MASPLRLQFAGALYHSTARADRREAIYENPPDREQFLAIFVEICERYAHGARPDPRVHGPPECN